MDKKYILSVDSGTTSTRAIVFDKGANVIGVGQNEFTQFFPANSWVEHDPLEIWESQLLSIKEAIKNSSVSVSDIVAIGITNQRETTIVWDKSTGKPVYNAIVWQDRRTAEFCSDWKGIFSEEKVTEKTGLVIDPYFSGTKIKWILDQDPDIRKRAQQGELAFGTVDTWLIWNLTGGKDHVTDVTNASRTMLYNIHTGDWDDDILKSLAIPRSLLPRVVSCSEQIAQTEESLLGISIPITGIAGDQQAALFGQLCFEPGDSKNTYGTGCFTMMNTGSKPVQSSQRLLTTIAWKINDQVTYAMEGSIFVAGALIQWLRDQLNFIDQAKDIEPLALSVSSSDGITFIPALSGLGAPHWNAEAQGAIFGLTRGTEKGHIARAALEAICMRVIEVVQAMEKDAGLSIPHLKVDGGATQNKLLLQLQSNLMQKQIIRPDQTESTALGAALLAGLAVGFWTDLEEIKSLLSSHTSFQPEKTNEELERVKSNWRKRIKLIDQ